MASFCTPSAPKAQPDVKINPWKFLQGSLNSCSSVVIKRVEKEDPYPGLIPESQYFLQLESYVKALPQPAWRNLAQLPVKHQINLKKSLHHGPGNSLPIHEHYALHTKQQKAAAPTNNGMKLRLHQLGSPYRQAPDVRPLLAAVVYLPQDKSHVPVPVYSKADLETILPASLGTNPTTEHEQARGRKELKTSRQQRDVSLKVDSSENIGNSNGGVPTHSPTKEGPSMIGSADSAVLSGLVLQGSDQGPGAADLKDLLPQQLSEHVNENTRMPVSANVVADETAPQDKQSKVGHTSSASPIVTKSGQTGVAEADCEEMEGSVPEPKTQRREDAAHHDDGTDQNMTVPNMTVANT
ncbi:hypothetical protein CEUSTIGMA_g13005.t1 [Chlamydomonas eustigma]|uniref:Uncharacterized protein n=1 Tax=Chlamydomonas eustigma TaxID=1157962 RepID=A0A250XS16_9CHLO|nr:hypothetical protein CEUSTIGMA_g13005.t1 [Chlamydomonas eustigma]|eukprot:GAX85590.1 hypothetical protein CEUSTIGMA_g13005.t1 [Chlamydomonas eustigma]